MTKDEFSDSNLIIVGGAPRSGTTLVQRIIGAHPLIYAGPEFDLLPSVVRLRDEFMKKIEGGRIGMYITPEGVDRHLRNMIVSIFAGKAVSAGKRYLSEKTPANCIHFKPLMAMLPRARFILVMRDPRAIVASILNVRDRMRQDGERPPTYCRNTRTAVEQINSSWKTAYEVVDGASNGEVVFHEDLIADPASAVEKLCGFIGVSFDERMLHLQGRPIETADTNTFRYWYSKERLSDGIDPDLSSKWTRRLGPRDLSIIAAHTFQNGPIREKYREALDYSRGRHREKIATLSRNCGIKTANLAADAWRRLRYVLGI